MYGALCPPTFGVTLTSPDRATPCRAEPDLFYPEDDDYTTASVREAVAACSTCWFKVECRELGASEKHGVWGATTPAERGFCL